MNYLSKLRSKIDWCNNYLENFSKREPFEYYIVPNKNRGGNLQPQIILPPPDSITRVILAEDVKKM